MTSGVATSSDDDLLGPRERLHPLYLLTGLDQALKGAWGLLAAGAYFAAKGSWMIVGISAALLVLFSIGSLYLRWIKLEYRVGAHEIRIDSGWLSRTSRAIPFDRVTDVDLEQGPLHRLFGLARVKLETGGSAGGREEEGVLHTIALERAEALREHIRGAKGIASAPRQAEAGTEEAPPIYAMDHRRVLTAGLFNFSLAVIAGLFGVTQTMGDALGFDPFERAFWAMLLDRSESLQQLVMAHRIAAISAGTILLVLLGIGTGLVRTLLREHGFRLDRSEAGFRRRRGLLTLTDVSIPAKRVQAAILANGPIRRHFGWWVLKLQSLAQDGGKGDHVVAPLAREEEAATILRTLDWPTGPASGDWETVSRAYVTSYAVKVLPLMIIPPAVSLLSSAGLSMAAEAPLVDLAAILWIAAAPVLVAARWLSWRWTRHAVNDDALFIATGWWRHRRSIVPRRKIQSIDISENWWSRLFGICTLRLGVAGGSGFSDHHVPALARARAMALRAELLA